MSVAHRDSDLFLTPALIGRHGGDVSFENVRDPLPIFDLNSTHPLPPFADRFDPGPAAPRESAAEPEGTIAGGAGLWMEGNVLMCLCPDCRAPMTIRLWLMIADCWRCGASLELSEEQEREAQRLLEQREAQRRPVEAPRKLAPQPPPAPAPSASPVAAAPRAAAVTNPARPAAAPPPASRSPEPPRPPQTTPSPRFKSPPQAAPPPPPPAPPPRAPERQPVRAPVAPAARPRSVLRRRPRKDNWLRRLLRDVPAWLISLILHMVMIMLMALITFTETRKGIFILMSTVVSRDRDEGEFKTKVDKIDDVKFDLPIPDNMDLKNKKQRDALLEANQRAQELQLDPDLPVPNLPSLSRVKELAASDDPVRRSLAVRDPRLRVEVAKKEGGTTLTEAAVSRGLRWLASQQKADGSWSSGERGTADTALGVLPFLGAGQTHFAGKYQDVTARGLRWLVEHQKKDGDLRGGTGQHPGMYAHGLASIVLCDAFGMTGDENLRGPAQKAIDFIVAAQNHEGGWRYQPKQDADLSVVGWQLMALQSAKMSGLKVPNETLELTNHYLDTVSSKDGSQYSYQRRGAATPTMTAEGLLCRMYLGWIKDNPGLTRGVAFLVKNHLPSKSERNIYYWYYGTQVFHHVGGEPWKEWNQRMRDILVDSQLTEGPNAGSWNPDGDRWGSSGGRVFQTSLSTCTLEVYYRHAPIYRKIKLD